MPDTSYPEDFCQEYATVHETVLLCECQVNACNGLESGVELLAIADKSTTQLPEGVGIQCLQCGGEDYQCGDEDDGGSFQNCAADVETCTITKLQEEASGSVKGILSISEIKHYILIGNMGTWMWLARGSYRRYKLHSLLFKHLIRQHLLLLHIDL